MIKVENDYKFSLKTNDNIIQNDTAEEYYGKGIFVANNNDNNLDFQI